MDNSLIRVCYILYKYQLDGQTKGPAFILGLIETMDYRGLSMAKEKFDYWDHPKKSIKCLLNYTLNKQELQQKAKIKHNNICKKHGFEYNDQ